MHLSWTKCEEDQWCSLLNVNLDHSHFRNLGGVYVIWYGGQQPATLYVGQGDIAARLAEHRQNDNILKFSHYGLFVTWAQVDVGSRNGVELFLAEHLQPKIGQRHPIASEITANFPW